MSANSAFPLTGITPATLSAISSNFVQGRLTLTSGSPWAFTNTGLTSTTLYYTPTNGNLIGLYNNIYWIPTVFSEVSIAVPSTTNTMYDCFGCLNGGALTLEAVAWTNDTTRATALALQDGIYVKSGDATRRYLGSFRTNGTTGTVSMDRTGIYVWNYYNRSTIASNISYNSNGGTNYTITSNVGVRQLGGVSTNNSIPYIVGVSSGGIIRAEITGFLLTTATTTGIYTMGFGNNSTSSMNAQSNIMAAAPTTIAGMLITTIGEFPLANIGLRTMYALENCNRSAGTFTITYGEATAASTGTLKITLDC